MLDASSATTAKLNAVPAGAVAGATTMNCVAAPALTVIGPVVPVIKALSVSVVVIVWLPEVLSVAAKLPVPLISVALAGSVARRHVDSAQSWTDSAGIDPLHKGRS